MQMRAVKWCVWIFCLSSCGWLGACEKTKAPSLNLPGTILVLQPVSERERVVKKELFLKLKLYDGDGLAHVKAVFQAQTLWEKHFPPNKYKELIIEQKIDLTSAKISDGRGMLTFFLGDQRGGKSKKSIELFVDRSGPSASWTQPQPGSTIRVRTKAIFKIKDASDIMWVKVKYNNKLIKEFSGGPYQFMLDPSDYPVGNTTFWIQAKDSLGNLSARSFSFLIVGAALGMPCSYTDSCKSPAICVKRKGDIRGYCRTLCRRDRDCSMGMKCLRAGKVRICENPYYLNKKGVVTVAALYEKCSKTKPCGGGLVCISPPNRDASCRTRCNNGRCPRGTKCRKVPWGEGGGEVNVCIETRPRRNTGQAIGQPCSPQQPCVKEAMCVSAGKQSAKCYKICSETSDCPDGVPCNSVPGKSDKICIKVPKRRVTRVGVYEQCDNKRLCRKGLQCMSSSSNPKPVCFPKCGSSYCGGESVCLPLGGNSICLNKCNPNGGSCPSGTKCQMLMRGTKGGYFCG